MSCWLSVTIIQHFYLDCSHTWGVEFLIRLWEQDSKHWHCNSTVSCKSLPENFPNRIEDIDKMKVELNRWDMSGYLYFIPYVEDDSMLNYCFWQLLHHALNLLNFLGDTRLVYEKWRNSGRRFRKYETEWGEGFRNSMVWDPALRKVQICQRCRRLSELEKWKGCGKILCT